MIDCSPLSHPVIAHGRTWLSRLAHAARGHALHRHAHALRKVAAHPALADACRGAAGLPWRHGLLAAMAGAAATGLIGAGFVAARTGAPAQPPAAAADSGPGRNVGGGNAGGGSGGGTGGGGAAALFGPMTLADAVPPGPLGGPMGAAPDLGGPPAPGMLLEALPAALAGLPSPGAGPADSTPPLWPAFRREPAAGPEIVSRASTPSEPVPQQVGEPPPWMVLLAALALWLAGRLTWREARWRRSG